MGEGGGSAADLRSTSASTFTSKKYTKVGNGRRTTRRYIHDLFFPFFLFFPIFFFRENSLWLREARANVHRRKPSFCLSTPNLVFIELV